MKVGKYNHGLISMACKGSGSPGKPPKWGAGVGHLEWILEEGHGEISYGFRTHCDSKEICVLLTFLF